MASKPNSSGSNNLVKKMEMINLTPKLANLPPKSQAKAIKPFFFRLSINISFSH